MRKTMEMDYGLTESARVRALRARQDEYRKRSGMCLNASWSSWSCFLQHV